MDGPVVAKKELSAIHGGDVQYGDIDYDTLFQSRKKRKAARFVDGGGDKRCSAPENGW